MICFAPLILAGYLFTIQTPWHHTANVDGSQVEIQTCESGIGAHGKVSTSGLYGTGLHYGIKWPLGDHWSVTAQPRVGMSYTSEPRRELPSSLQFEVGLQVLVGYDRFRVGVEYWHLSNAGLKSPNIGLDMIGVTTGWVF